MRLGLVLPLALFVALAVALAAGLGLDPGRVPSPLIGKPAPAFSLPRLHQPEQRLTTADLLGRVSLLNVWATWCVGCREEHPLLLEIARETGVAIYGLNYKDQYKEALAWLARHGDPYVASGYDADGRAGIDLGVYGLPETFVLDARGAIAYKHIGPLTREVWQRDIAPLLDKLASAEQ